MRRLLLPLLMVGLVAACFKQEMPEVNEANCQIDKLKAMPDNALRQEFAGLCFRRGTLKKGSDKGLRAW